MCASSPMEAYTPWAVLLNIPPRKDLPERVGAHTLTIHRDRLPTHIDRARTRECRGVRPLLDEERVSRIEQYLGNAAPPATPTDHLWSARNTQTWRSCRTHPYCPCGRAWSSRRKPGRIC